MDHPPAFFKVFIPEICSRRMQIPPAFTSYLRRQRTSNATFLRDHQSNVWTVELSREGRDFFLDKGWVRFVKDNCIEQGDFLVFELSGDRFFDFKHFGRNACEKEKATSFRFTFKPHGLESGEEEDEDDVEADNEEGEEELEVYEETEKKKKESTRVRTSKKISVTRLTRADIAGYEDEIFGSGVVPRPTNPYFVIKIRPENRQELFIPFDVVRDHDLNLPREIDIVDEKGKIKHARPIKVWKCKRIAVKKWWGPFKRCNQLKINDKCLFEFVKNKRKLSLKVRIFRA